MSDNPLQFIYAEWTTLCFSGSISLILWFTACARYFLLKSTIDVFVIFQLHVLIYTLNTESNVINFINSAVKVFERGKIQPIKIRNLWKLFKGSFSDQRHSGYYYYFFNFPTLGLRRSKCPLEHLEYPLWGWGGSC